MHSTTNPIAPDPRPTPITIEDAIANFPPATRMHPVTADNGAIMARHPFAQRPAPNPRLIHNESNPPDHDGDSDGAFTHDRDDDYGSSSGPPAITQGIAISPANFRTLPSQKWSQIMAGNKPTHPWTRSQPKPRAHYRDRTTYSTSAWSPRTANPRHGTKRTTQRTGTSHSLQHPSQTQSPPP